MLNKCRACLSIGDDLKLITEDDPDTQGLKAMYASINNLEWISNNQISSYLCDHCQTLLEISYEFRKKCHESYNILQKEITSETSSDLPESQEYNQNECANNRVTIVENLNEIRESELFCEDIEKSTRDIKDEQDISYKCIVCPYILPTAQALCCHMSLMHKDVKRNWCHLCNNIFYNLSNHRKSSHNSSIEINNPTASTFESDSSVEKFQTNSPSMHSDGYSDSNKFKIECSVETTEPEVVNEDQSNCELQSVNPQNNYCEKCDKKVRSLPIHMKKAHSKAEEDKPKKFVCYVCVREMKSSAGLRAHLKLHGEGTAHKCSFCGKPHKNRGQLIEHERTHTGEKPFICNVCAKGFAQAGALGTHMKLHTGRPEVCTICDKRFCRPSELKLHLRKHSGEKPFLCTECGKAFIQKSHLMEHMKTHSDLRPFRCVYCDKAFKQKSLLTFHLRIHSGYKPYQCKLCDYACIKSYRLRQHMKLHETVVKKDKKNFCPVCQKGFSSQPLLNGHMTSFHNAIL